MLGIKIVLAAAFILERVADTNKIFKEPDAFVRPFVALFVQQRFAEMRFAPSFLAAAALLPAKTVERRGTCRACGRSHILIPNADPADAYVRVGSTAIRETARQTATKNAILPNNRNVSEIVALLGAFAVACFLVRSLAFAGVGYERFDILGYISPFPPLRL